MLKVENGLQKHIYHLYYLSRYYLSPPPQKKKQLHKKAQFLKLFHDHFLLSMQQ